MKKWTLVFRITLIVAALGLLTGCAGMMGAQQPYIADNDWSTQYFGAGRVPTKLTNGISQKMFIKLTDGKQTIVQGELQPGQSKTFRLNPCDYRCKAKVWHTDRTAFYRAPNVNIRPNTARAELTLYFSSTGNVDEISEAEFNQP